MFDLKPLPYATNALEPYLSKQVLELHHGKHQKAYVKNLNKLVKDTSHENKTLEKIIIAEGESGPMGIKAGPIFDNAAQIYNHEFYWKSMTPADLSKFDKSSELGKALIKRFESFDEFKKEFTDVAKKLFGSGWIWLVEHKGKLDVVPMRNAQCPLNSKGMIPLLAMDVWEHAYTYQKDYFADRPAYIKAWFNIVNWERANDLYQQAHK